MSTTMTKRSTKAARKSDKKSQPQSATAPSNDNGKHEAATVPAVQPQISEVTDADIPKDLERLHQIQLIGHDVKRTRTKLMRQETEEAKAESALKEERAKTRKIFNELNELLTDLSTLAAGGSLERLPFSEKPAETKPAADDNAWRDVPLADLGIEKKGVVNRLIDAGVMNLGQLEDWRASRNTKPEIKGMGEAAMQAVEDAIVAYWSKHVRPGVEAAVKAANAEESASLVWHEMSENQHYAETTSGIRRADDSKAIPQFVVSKADSVWNVDQSAGCLMPETAPGTFATVGEARAWCQKREDELKAAAEPKPLEWQPGESEFHWVAVNTAGIEEDYNNDETMVAAFEVSLGRGGLATIDMSSDLLLPTQFPLNFPNLQEAKAYCEERNRDLCLHAREQMPELFEGKPSAFAEDTPIIEPKDIGLSEKEMFAVDQLDALVRMGEKPKRVKHVSPLLGAGFLGITSAGRHPCVVLGTTSVRGQECLRLGLLERAAEWASVNPTPVTGKEARDRVVAGTFTGIRVIACNCEQIIGDVFHVRVGKGGAS